jgi:hypothetical protein
MDDKESGVIQKLLKSADKVNALKWLSEVPTGVHRNIGEMTNRDSVAYVRKLIKLGAADVIAAEIGINGKYESTDTLVATLPDDPAARKAIFNFEGRRVEEMGYDASTDIGQRYLFMWFD